MVICSAESSRDARRAAQAAEPVRGADRVDVRDAGEHAVRRARRPRAPFRRRRGRSCGLRPPRRKRAPRSRRPCNRALSLRDSRRCRLRSRRRHPRARRAPPQNVCGRARAAPACGRCGLDVHVADRVVHRDIAYHAQCLRCGACRRSVVDLAWGTLDGDDVILCDDRGVTAGRRSCLVKARTQSLEHARADKDFNERPSEADVAGIREAKLRAVELVGDELEQLALTGIAPTCALCGGRFAPSDRIVMQGMVKMHEACMTGGKPTQSRNGPRLPPARALKDAPATLVIKVSLGKGVATFYVARRAGGRDLRRLRAGPRRAGAAEAPRRRRRARRRDGPGPLAPGRGGCPCYDAG